MLRAFISRRTFFLLLLLIATSLSSCATNQLEDTWVRPMDKMTLVYVPEGEFQMGSSKELVFSAKDICKQSLGNISGAVCDATSFMDEFPDHKVSLSDYWIDQTEVTNAQYRICIEAGGCELPKDLGSYSEESYFDNPDFDDYPVVQVTWTMAWEYCNWAGARLPTEAEWEYASRGPEGFIFPWGSEFDRTKLNYCDSSCDGISDPVYNDGYPETSPVGSFPSGASWVGALDMAGNVREWVNDWYAQFPLDDLTDPRGPVSGDEKTMKGGSWYDAPFNIRSTNRGGLPTDYWRHKVGFRCVLDSLYD
jgi:formylglycine-generating enzyme required for sulfatase activity